jgi:hypothetical protein
MALHTVIWFYRNSTMENEMIEREAVHGAPESWLNYPNLSLISIKAAVASCDVTEAIVERTVILNKIPFIELEGERFIPDKSLAFITDFYLKQVGAVRKVLENAARQRQVVTYRNLSEAAGLTYQIVRDKRILSKIIETLCKQTHNEDSILLPGIARRTRSATSMPPENFFIVADRLGYKVDDDRKFLEMQTTKVWDFYCRCRFPQGYPRSV